MVKEGLGAPMPSENRRSQDVSDVSANSILTAPVSLSGSIKWFDVAKGFGFVVPDGGGPDILLHVTCL